MLLLAESGDVKKIKFCHEFTYNSFKNTLNLLDYLLYILNIIPISNHSDAVV